jgi:uncharacterized cysteine cluster protein YcgN (CxxCxxCC family)
MKGNSMAIKQPSYTFSSWENYQEWESTCSNCSWTGLLARAVTDWESDMVSSLHCPQCDNKLGLMGNEASREEIVEFAKKGSHKAIRHLKSFEN